jgi:hypothetical protein
MIRSQTEAEQRADWIRAVTEWTCQRVALRLALKAHGLSYAAFARECGCSASNVGQYLNGSHDWPIPAYILRTARELGLVA